MSDSVANAREFARQHAQRFPELAEKWVADLRGNPFAYGEALGLESDNVRGIATLMEESVKRIRRPGIGDLVRFVPSTDTLKGSPYSGRVIAALDTGGGDVRYHLRAETGESGAGFRRSHRRYHLRAETGPDQGMECTVYGRDGTFHAVGLDEAVGFDRNRKEPEKTAELKMDIKDRAAVGYNRYHQRLPEQVDLLIQSIRKRLAEVDPTNGDAIARIRYDYMGQADAVFGIIQEGDDRGAFRPMLELDHAGVEPERKAELRNIWREHFDQQANRYREAVDNANLDLQDRLKERGKEILRNPEALSPKETVMACYWKQGILVDDKSPVVGKMLDAVESRDLQYLLSLIGNNSQNPASKEAFSRLTGIQLGKTQKERVAQLNEWAGPERVAALRKAAEDRVRYLAEEAPRKTVRETFDALYDMSIRLSEKSAETMNGQEWMAAKVTEGYTTVASRKRGGALIRYLKNPETENTTWLKDSRFQNYCKAVQELEPSGDVVKAMETAKVPLNLIDAQAPQAAQAPRTSRGDYLRYQRDNGVEIEGVVLDSTKLGKPGIETLRLRRIYRWPNGAPGMDGADHITFTVLPESLLEHVPGAVKPGADLDAIDPLTDAYKRAMGSDSERGKSEHAVLTAVETARGIPPVEIIRQ